MEGKQLSICLGAGVSVQFRRALSCLPKVWPVARSLDSPRCLAMTLLRVTELSCHESRVLRCCPLSARSDNRLHRRHRGHRAQIVHDLAPGAREDTTLHGRGAPEMSALITWKSQRSRPFDLICDQLEPHLQC